jgi:16S rRNA (cytosine1402-N4)-methyltransferase
MHIPVLLQEVIKYLEPGPGKKFIDVTFGEGGHAKEIVRLGSSVLGIDWDPSVVTGLDSEFSAKGGSACGGKNQKSKIKIVQGNFADLKEIAEENGFTEVDGILFDLGLGSHQLDDPKRGFAFQKDGPLDMRYDRKSKINTLTAADIVNDYLEKELTEVFQKFGEEYRFGKRVARAIVEIRKNHSIETTSQLFEIIKKCLPAKLRFKAGDVARRIFQALRIEVNEELQNLEKALPQAFELLKKNGRLAVISFHSLEDRIVKNFFKGLAKKCVCPPEFPVCRCEKIAVLKILTNKPVVASESETKINPRARSAKLRAAEKIS